MIDYKDVFKNKKVTLMGLGLLGRSLGIAKFLAELGADLIITDLKPSIMLNSSLKELRKYKNVKYTLGEHRLIDFKNRDLIIKSAGVPLNSIYIKEARKNKIPIEMDVSLFAKLAPEVKIVGVTGTRGKSMTTMLIYEILKKSLKDKNVFLGGNIRGVATLPFLKIAKPGDVLVAELDSWQLQGFGDSKLSPNISVFTSFMPDHMNYYDNDLKKYFADKANIFKYQRKGDALIVRPHVKKIIPKNVQSKLIVADIKNIVDYKFIVPGEHQRENLACAVLVARLFKISEDKIKQVVKNFKGVEGRLQYVKTLKGVKIFNDNNATTPEATISGIRALFEEGKEGKIILISGGADKNLDLKLFIDVVNTLIKAVIFLPGTGTDRLLKQYKIKPKNILVKDLKVGVRKALEFTEKGDIILFSPAFASFGQFANEYERNDLFMSIIKKLK